MKKTILLFTFLIAGLQISKAQTAVNFNCNDCAGTNHDLFTDLNAGKVVVISFVMPCSSCIGPTLSAYNEVQNYATSNPGKVLFYIIDDNGNTSCSSLTTWCNTNGLGSATKISNTSVTEAPYGTGGMPKIVVLGGTNHDVFFTENGSLNVTNFNAAIQNALTAVSVRENSFENFQLSLFPNPAKDKRTFISYNLKSTETIALDIYNTAGALVKKVIYEQQTAGKHEQALDLSGLSNGTYFIKLHVGNKTDVLKFVIAE